MFGSNCRKRGPSLCEIALRFIARIGGRRASVFGLREAGFSLTPCCCGRFRSSNRIVASSRLIRAIGDRLKLLLQPVPLGFNPRGMRPRRFQRSIGNPSLGPHGRLPRKELRERRLRIAGRTFEFA